jgi:hypothetical protein
MNPHQPPAPEPEGARRSDDEIRAIAKQLVEGFDSLGPAEAGELRSSPDHGLSPADEERVENALADLGALDPEATIRSEREAAGEAAPPRTPRGESDGAGGGARGH